MNTNERKKLFIRLKYVGSLGMNPTYGRDRYSFDERNDFTQEIPYDLYCDLMRKFAHDFIPIDAVVNEVKTVMKDVVKEKKVVSVCADEVNESVEDAEEVFPCQYCGRELKTNLGRFSHERSCKAKKDK